MEQLTWVRIVSLTPGVLVTIAVLRWLAASLGSRRGAALGSTKGRMLGILGNADRILWAAQPSEHGVLYYKDYGLLLCESQVLRRIARETFPRKEYRQFLVDLEELTDIGVGVERQKGVIRRISMLYSKWFY
jgi:nuclear-control-of-ATPase protein 2